MHPAAVVNDNSILGDPTVAIAFGCGGARGIAHIHVIEALDELGIRPKAIAGASIGAIMGTAMAAGMSGKEIREHTLQAVGSHRQVLSRFWRSRPASMKDILRGGFRVGQFNLERLLKGFLPEAIPEDFAQLTTPMKVVATDFYSGGEVVCETGSLVDALAASASIPAVFLPVRRDGRILVDGGLSNPVPFDHLCGSSDILIGVDVAGSPGGNDQKFPSSLDALYGVGQLMQQSIIALKLRAFPPDVLLKPEVSKVRTLDFMKARDILAQSAGIKDETKLAVDREFLKHRVKLAG